MTERIRSSAGDAPTDEARLRTSVVGSAAERAFGAVREAIGLLLMAPGREHEALRSLAGVLRLGLRRPDQVAVKIRSNGFEAATRGFASTPWNLRCLRQGSAAGTEVEVVYLKEPPTPTDEALFIPKPFSARSLLESLREALGEGSRER